MAKIRNVGFVGRLFGGIHEFMQGFEAAWPAGGAPRPVCVMPEDIERVLDLCGASRRISRLWA